MHHQRILTEQEKDGEHNRCHGHFGITPNRLNSFCKTVLLPMISALQVILLDKTGASFVKKVGATIFFVTSIAHFMVRSRASLAQLCALFGHT